MPPSLIHLGVHGSRVTLKLAPPVSVSSVHASRFCHSRLRSLVPVGASYTYSYSTSLFVPPNICLYTVSCSLSMLFETLQDRVQRQHRISLTPLVKVAVRLQCEVTPKPATMTACALAQPGQTKAVCTRPMQPLRPTPLRAATNSGTF